MLLLAVVRAIVRRIVSGNGPSEFVDLSVKDGELFHLFLHHFQHFLDVLVGCHDELLVCLDVFVLDGACR